MKKEKIINIIGMGNDAVNAPFGDGERWGINCAYVYGDMDKSFWLHHPQVLPQSLRIDKDTMKITEVFKKFPKMEIVTLNPYSIELINDPEDGQPELIFSDDLDNPEGTVLKRTTGYPMHRYDQEFASYATSSVMYLIVMAVFAGADRIRLYGFELWSGFSHKEYAFEKAGVEHACFWAMGRGTKVDGICNLIKAENSIKGLNNRYGYIS